MLALVTSSNPLKILEIPHRANHKGGKCHKTHSCSIFYGYTIGVVFVIPPNEKEYKPKCRFFNSTRWKDRIGNEHEIYGLN